MQEPAAAVKNIDLGKLDPAKIIYLDLVSREVRQDFQSYLAQWAKRAPFYIIHDGVLQVMIARHKDYAEVSADIARFSVELPKRPGVEKFNMFMDMTLIAQLDPPAHDRLRRLINPPFSPAGVQRLETAIKTIVDDLITQIAARGGSEFDAMGDFADNIMPILMLDFMFHIPKEQWPIFIAMNEALEITEHIKPGEGFPQAYKTAMLNAKKAVDDLILERRKNPGDDFISQLIQVRDGSDKLSDKELFEQVYMFLAAALNSTASGLGGALLTLGRHPDQFEVLKRDPSLVVQAVEECMRVHGSGYITFPRFAREDTEVGGTYIPKGVPLLMGFGAANYDPERYADPERFDIYRNPKGITAFGAPGPHLCLGNRLARTVIRLAILGLMERFPKIRLSDVNFKPTYKGHLSEVHCVSLPVRVD